MKASKVVPFVSITRENGMTTRAKKEASQREDGNPVVFEIIAEDGEVVEMEATCAICQHRGFWLSEDRDLLYCSKCRAPLAKRRYDVPPEWEVKWVT